MWAYRLGMFGFPGCFLNIFKQSGELLDMLQNTTWKSVRPYGEIPKQPKNCKKLRKNKKNKKKLGKTKKN